MKRRKSNLLKAAFSLSMQSALFWLLTMVVAMILLSLSLNYWIRQSGIAATALENTRYNESNLVFQRIDTHLISAIASLQALEALDLQSTSIQAVRQLIDVEITNALFIIDSNHETFKSPITLSPFPESHTFLEKRLLELIAPLKEFSKSHSFSTNEHLTETLNLCHRLDVTLQSIQRLNTLAFKDRISQIEALRQSRYRMYLAILVIFILAGGYLSWLLLRSIKENMNNNVRSEAHIRSLMNSTAQAIYSIDNKGICTYCNTACVKLLGYQNDSELIGKNMHRLIHHTKKDGSPFPEQECPIYHFQCPETVLNEKRDIFWTAGNTPLDVEYWSYPVTKLDGAVSGKVIAFLDISHKIKSEKQLLEYQHNLEEMVNERTRKLNEAHAELVRLSHKAGMSEIAGGVLHNVGNVLNSVNIGTETALRLINRLSPKGLEQLGQLLNEHLADPTQHPLPADIGRYIDLLVSEMHKNRDDLMSELLALASHNDHIKRIIATQQKYAASASVNGSVDISMLVEDALSINAELLKSNDIVIIKDLEGELTFPTQQHKLLQILINLISNAAKALHEVIHEEHAPEITISSRCDDNHLQLSVRDNGPGIQKQSIEKIFELGVSYRADGHGLGLHLSATMAQELGGSLRAANNSPGTGMTFTLKLPALGSTTSQQEISQQTAATGDLND